MCGPVSYSVDDFSASGTDVIALCFMEAPFNGDAHLEGKRLRTGLKSCCLYSHL